MTKKTDDEKKQHRRGLKVLLFFISAAFLLLVCVVSWQIVTGAKEAEGPSPDEAPATEAARYVTLPAPTKSTEGLPTHWPQTPEGATASAAAYAMAGSGVLDYAAAQTVVKAYYGDFIASGHKPEDLASELVQTSRTALGVPLVGDAPVGVGVRFTLEGVRWEAATPESVKVFLSFTRQDTKLGGQKNVAHGAFALPVAWTDGRWQVKANKVEPATYAAPGTVGFIKAGWKLPSNTEWAGGLS